MNKFTVFPRTLSSSINPRGGLPRDPTENQVQEQLLGQEGGDYIHVWGLQQEEKGGGPLLQPPLASSLGAMLLSEGSPSGLDVFFHEYKYGESPTSETAVHMGRPYGWV